MDAKKSLEKEEGFSLQKGPYRNYQPVDTYWKYGVGWMKWYDALLSGVIAVGYMYCMTTFHADRIKGDLNEAEKNIYDAVQYYKWGKFRLAALPPFGIQLLSLMPLSTMCLRQVSLAFSSLTLGALYLILRRVSTFPPFAIGCAVIIGVLPHYQAESTSISVDTLYWFLFLLSFYLWRTAVSSRLFSKRWFNCLGLLSMTLGLGASTKFIGPFACLWIISLAMKQFWTILGDPEVKVRSLIKYTLFNVLFLGIIPLAIFTSSYTLQLAHWSKDSPEFSQYMSPQFKAYLRGPVEQPKTLYYDSIVTIRHLESLGGYLHSHNHTYPAGSQEQQVTSTQEEEDYNNQWVVERPRPRPNTILTQVKDFGKIRLRHRATGKLLRASSAKPPVSEQEYTSEVSCTGDANYVGDSDELWTVVAVGDPLHSSIGPIKSKVMFMNDGHRCTLLSHDTRLPSWGFHQQEVLCVQSPNEARALFEFETLKLNATDEVEQDAVDSNWESVSGLTSLLTELIQRQYKWGNYVKDFQVKPEQPAEKWPLRIFEEKYVNHIWLISIVYPAFFVIYQTFVTLRYRLPWTTETTPEPAHDAIYNEFAVDCVLGWIMSYRPFLSYPFADQRLESYLPSLMLGQLLVWRAVDSGYKSWPWLAIPMCIYIAYLAGR